MFKPIPLNLPPFPFKLNQEGNKLYIFDELRKKQLLLTPEEWVRQHWIRYLMDQKRFPKALLKVEGGLKLNTLSKRTDLVLFDRNGQRLLIAEFKAPQVKITQKAFDQVARYNMVHQVRYLVVSNGLQHYYAKVDFEQETYAFLPELPTYDLL